jgi:hypothetical protein
MVLQRIEVSIQTDGDRDLANKGNQNKNKVDIIRFEMMTVIMLQTKQPGKLC